MDIETDASLGLSYTSMKPAQSLIFVSLNKQYSLILTKLSLSLSLVSSKHLCNNVHDRVFACVHRTAYS